MIDDAIKLSLKITMEYTFPDISDTDFLELVDMINEKKNNFF